MKKVSTAVAKQSKNFSQPAITLKTVIGCESTVRVVCVSLAGAAPELLLFFNTGKAQLLDG